jgi:hypothetical protein
MEVVMRWRSVHITVAGAACAGLILWAAATTATGAPVEAKLQPHDATVAILTGFGAKLADFAKAHPKNSSTCPGIKCHGKNITTGGVPVPQFVTVLTAGGRVSSYTQDLSDHTSLNAAKAEVLALLPPDAKTVKFTIRHASNGTCAAWNLSSSSLASVLKTSDGNIGIQLHTILPSGDDGWSTGAINSATVGAFALPSNFPC